MPGGIGLGLQQRRVVVGKERAVDVNMIGFGTGFVQSGDRLTHLEVVFRDAPTTEQDDAMGIAGRAVTEPVEVPPVDAIGEGGRLCRIVGIVVRHPLAVGFGDAEDLVGVLQQQGLVVLATGVVIVVLRVFVGQTAVHDKKDLFVKEAAEGQEEVVDVADAGEDHDAAEEKLDEDLGELK